MNAMNMLEPKSWRRCASILALGVSLWGGATAASAQTRLSLADLAAQIEALRGQVTSLTQANSNLQGQLDSLNANLGVVQLGVAGAQVKVQDAQNRVAAVEGGLAAVQGNSVLALDGVLAYDVASETARFTGVDVQVTNGQGANTLNGRGNLIVGYNQPRVGSGLCSKGEFDSPTGVLCTANGGVFAPSHKSGSHNLVVGEGHAYSDYGGVIFGTNNAVTNRGGSVLGGDNNVVRGTTGSVAGGVLNEVAGVAAVVTAGTHNAAQGSFSAIGGGYGNSTNATHSTIGGGYGNSTNAAYSTISGGMGHSSDSWETASWKGGGLSQPR